MVKQNNYQQPVMAIMVLLLLFLGVLIGIGIGHSMGLDTMGDVCITHVKTIANTCIDSIHEISGGCS